MNNRIKKVRTDAGLSTRAFGDILNVSNTTISLLENGKRNVTDRTIADICREFYINEEWLRTGKGEMYADAIGNEFMKLSAELDLSEYTDDVIVKGILEDVIKTWLQLDAGRKKVLLEVANKFLENNKKRQDV